MLDGSLPVFYTFGQAEIYQPASTVLPKYYVVQFDISVDDAFGVKVIQTGKHLQTHTIDLQQLLVRQNAFFAIFAPAMKEGGKVHFSQFAQKVHPNFLIVSQRTLVTNFPPLSSHVGLLKRHLRAFRRATSEYNTIRAHRLAQYNHFELWVVLHFVLLHLQAFLFRKCLQFKPASVISQDIGVLQVSMCAWLRKQPKETFFCLLCAKARLDSHHLCSVLSLVQQPKHTPHLSETTTPHTTQVHELTAESLNRIYSTLSWEALRKSKPSIDIIRMVMKEQPEHYHPFLLLFLPLIPPHIVFPFIDYLTAYQSLIIIYGGRQRVGRDRIARTSHRTTTPLDPSRPHPPQGLVLLRSLRDRPGRDSRTPRRSTSNAEGSRTAKEEENYKNIQMEEQVGQSAKYHSGGTANFIEKMGKSAPCAHRRRNSSSQFTGTKQCCLRDGTSDHPGTTQQ